MNKISQAEREYIREGFKTKIRNDGRANTNIRDVWLQLRTLDQANGSSTFLDPDTSVKIHIGIKLEIGTPTLEQPEEGIIKLTVDSAQRQSVSSYDKKDLTDMHQDMKYLLDEFMIRPLNKKGLCHVKGKICWVVNIDVFCLSVLREVYLDKISLGIRAALYDLEIPELVVTQNQINGEYDIDIVEDKIKKIKDLMEFDKIPILITVGESDKNLVVDLTDEEFQALDSRYVVSADLKGDIYGIHKLEKIGSGGVLFEEMPKVFSLAKTATYELIKNQNNFFMQTKA